jgi:ankyrin repeat protein
VAVFDGGQLEFVTTVQQNAMAGLPFVAACDYKTPFPPTALEQSLIAMVRRDETASVASALRDLSEQTLVHACVLEAAIEGGNAALVALLLAFQGWDTRCCAPLHVAVESRDEAVVRLVLRDPNVYLNGGTPLRRCVELNEPDLLALLLHDGRIDVCKGGTLHIAVVKGDLRSVKLLMQAPGIKINAFVPGRGTTVLCQAALSGHDEIFRVLLTHPQIDINKGFLATPLQHCVDMGNTPLVRLLLSRSPLQVNKAIGEEMPSPLEASVATDRLEITKLLLCDTRTVVPLRLIDQLERNDNIGMLQLVADLTSTCPLGTLWRRRIIVATTACALTITALVVDLVLVISAAFSGLKVLAAMLIVLQMMSCVGTAAMGFTSGQRAAAGLRLLPFIPLCSCVYTARVTTSLVVAPPNFDRRREAFLVLQWSSYCDAATSICRAVLIGGYLMLHEHVPVGSTAVVAVFANVVAVVAAAVLYKLRAHNDAPLFCGSKFRYGALAA